MNDILLDVIRLHIKQKNWADLFVCAQTTKANLAYARKTFTMSMSDADLEKMIKSSVEKDEKTALYQLQMIEDDAIPKLKPAAIFAVPGACALAKPQLLAALIKRFNIDMTDELLSQRTFERFTWQFHYMSNKKATIVNLGKTLLQYDKSSRKKMNGLVKRYAKPWFKPNNETYPFYIRIEILNEILAFI